MQNRKARDMDQITHSSLLLGNLENFNLSLVRELDAYLAGSAQMLIASAAASGGMSQLLLREGAAPLLTGQSWVPGGGGGVFTVGDTTLLPLQSQTLLLTSDALSGQSRLYRLPDGDDVPTSVGALQMADGTRAILGESAFASVGGQAYLLASTPGSGGLQIYELGHDLRLTLRDSAADTAKTTLAHVSDLRIAQPGGHSYALVSSSSEDGLSSYAIGADGTLELRDTLGPKDGLWVSGMEATLALQSGGEWFCVGASAGSGTLCAVRINPMGAMFITDLVMDTLDTRFGGAAALDSLSVNDRNLIFAAGNDGGLALLELLPGGQFYHHQSLEAAADWDIGPVLALEASAVGGEAQVLLSGGDAAGIAQLVLPLGQLGDLRYGGDAAEALAGGALDDLLMGGRGNDTLSGGGGDDTLIAGSGADRLQGGRGADVFVFTADGRPDVIVDFEKGVDRIDLDDWGMVYDPSALTISATTQGALITWRNEAVQVQSADGTPITPSEWSAEDFIF